MPIFSPLSRRKRRISCNGLSQAGFTLAEVALAMIVFAMMTILFAAVFPMAVRGAHYSGSYAQAAMLAQHKLDQLRSAGYTRLFVPTGDNSLSSLGIIDSPQPGGYPVTNGAATTYSIATADGLVSDGTTAGYFPAGSTGTVTVQDYAAFNSASGAPSGTLAYVTVTIRWAGAGLAPSSYRVSAVIAKAAQP